MFEELRNRVLKVAVKSYSEKLVAGTSGNVSEYNPIDQVMAITPSTVPYSTLQASDVVIMKLDGSIIECPDGFKPSSEWRMHAEIYNSMSNDGINAIVHTHSPRATSFAVVHEKIPLILIEMIPFLGGDILLAEFSLPGTDGLGFKAVEVLQGRKACLLANHGVLAIGKTLDEAYVSAVYTEDAATIYHFACQVGIPKIIPENFVKQMQDKMNM